MKPVYETAFDRLKLTAFCHTDPAEGGRSIDRKRVSTYKNLDWTTGYNKSYFSNIIVPVFEKRKLENLK